MQQILPLRIRANLLRGRVRDAEEMAGDDPDMKAIIAEWKKRYEGVPHVQWDGKVSPAPDSGGTNAEKGNENNA